MHVQECAHDLVCSSQLPAASQVEDGPWGLLAVLCMLALVHGATL